jgi:hypothetical protein
MDPRVSIVVRNGSLIGAGTPDEPVIFSAALLGSNWGQILVYPNVTKQQDLLLSNVIITGAGSPSLPAVRAQRVSELTNVSVVDCIGGGIFVEGNFRKLLMDSVRSIDVNSPSGSTEFNVKIAGSGTATINNSYLSTSAVYELAVYNSVALTATNLEMYPKATNYYGIFSWNTFTAVESLVYDESFLNNEGTGGYAIYAMGQSFEMRSSRIVFSRIGARVLASSSSFEGNTWTGHPQSYRFFDSSQVGSVSLCNNTFQRSSCSMDCFDINGEKVEFLENLISGIMVAGSRSLLRLNSIEPNIYGNRFEHISGNNGLEVASAPSLFNFSHNAWINVSSLVSLVTTTTLFSDIQGGSYVFPANYWDTTSVRILQSRSLDAETDPRLASISYAAIFVDADMTTLLLTPVTSPCIDLVSRTIGCVVGDASVVVPAGLYYAHRSITLRHPNSHLVFKAGARIMFAPGASIRVDEGTLEVHGTNEAPVLMTSTSRLLGEFGGKVVPNSTQWGGVWLGPNAKPTVTKSDEYVSGSVLQGCVIQDAGYFTSSAAVYVGHVSVMLDHVSVLDSGSDGVQFLNTRSAILVKDSIISRSRASGITFGAPSSTSTLQNVVIRDSGSNGLSASRHKDLIISNCRFDRNGRTQILAYGGDGALVVTKRYTISLMCSTFRCL